MSKIHSCNKNDRNFRIVNPLGSILSGSGSDRRTSSRAHQQNPPKLRRPPGLNACRCCNKHEQFLSDTALVSRNGIRNDGKVNKRKGKSVRTYSTEDVGIISCHVICLDLGFATVVPCLGFWGGIRSNLYEHIHFERICQRYIGCFSWNTRIAPPISKSRELLICDQFLPQLAALAGLSRQVRSAISSAVKPDATCLYQSRR